MKLVAENIGVDAGMIMVADMDYAKTVSEFGFCMDKVRDLGQILEVPNGKYRVHYRLPDEFEGDDEEMEEYDICSGIEELTVTGGKIFVCDPCYPIGKDDSGNYKGDSWGDWLGHTEFGDNLKTDKAFIISSMGGDGCYKVELELVQIS